MKKNKIENDPAVLIMMTPKERREREKLWRNEFVREVIESQDHAHVRYISPLPRGDGKIHSVKGKVVAQDKLHLYVKRPHSSEVRILKSQMFLMTTQEKRRPRRRKPDKERGDKK